MRKIKHTKGFRIIAGLLLLTVGVQRCISGEYLSGGISLAAGAIFIAAAFFQKGGGQK